MNCSQHNSKLQLQTQTFKILELVSIFLELPTNTTIMMYHSKCVTAWTSKSVFLWWSNIHYDHRRKGNELSKPTNGIFNFNSHSWSQKHEDIYSTVLLANVNCLMYDWKCIHCHKYTTWNSPVSDSVTVISRSILCKDNVSYIKANYLTLCTQYDEKITWT